MEWKCKPLSDKTWDSFNFHFGEKAKECKKSNNLTDVKNFCTVNVANQDLLEAQKYVRPCTDMFPDEFQNSILPSSDVTTIQTTNSTTFAATLQNKSAFLDHSLQKQHEPKP